MIPGMTIITVHALALIGKQGERVQRIRFVDAGCWKARTGIINVVEDLEH